MNKVLFLNLHKLFFRFAALLSIVVSTLSHAHAETTYTIGIVPQFEARKLRLIWKPILDEIEKETGFKFIIRGSPTIPAFENEFNSGKFDFAYMNPYHIMLANKSQGYIPLVRDVGRKLFGILVVSKTSGINSVEDLNGKLLAFPAPNALGASLLLRADLRDKFHIDFEETYVKSHSSVYLNVILGQAEAGGGVQKTFKEQSSSIQNRLKVIYETDKLPPHPIAVHPRVPEGDREKVTQAFLNLGKSEDGKVLLSKIPITNVGPTSMEDYLPLSKLGLEKYYVNP